MIDYRRLAVPARELDFEVLWLASAATEEQTDADLPGLAALASPVRDRNRAVGRMLAEGQFRHNVLQPPWSDLHAMLVANLEEIAERSLKLARRAGERAFRFEFAPGSAPFLIPHFRK